MSFMKEEAEDIPLSSPLMSPSSVIRNSLDHFDKFSTPKNQFDKVAYCFLINLIENAHKASRSSLKRVKQAEITLRYERLVSFPVEKKIF